MALLLLVLGASRLRQRLIKVLRSIGTIRLRQQLNYSTLGIGLLIGLFTQTRKRHVLTCTLVLSLTLFLPTMAGVYSTDHSFSKDKWLLNMTPEMAMQSTSKVPPAWMPSFEKRGYPFHVWLADVGVWTAGTEIAEPLRAACLVQPLGGTARVMACLLMCCRMATFQTVLTALGLKCC